MNKPLSGWEKRWASGAVGDGAYDNCWHTNLLSDVATQNCADSHWKGKTGYRPPYEGGFSIGTELVAAEGHRRLPRTADSGRRTLRGIRRSEEIG